VLVSERLAVVGDEEVHAGIVQSWDGGDRTNGLVQQTLVSLGQHLNAFSTLGDTAGTAQHDSSSGLRNRIPCQALAIKLKTDPPVDAQRPSL
jgi:hypothetical protein